MIILLQIYNKYKVLAGLYIHIPFCRKACYYCDFHFSTGMSLRKDMLEAIKKEMNEQNSWHNTPIQTIYFGGGTPSILTPDELAGLLSRVKQLFKVSHEAEITLEANPDDLSPAYIQQLKSVGINRLSIGTQTFNENTLKQINRSHSAQQAENALKSALKEGFRSVSADLIYGLPETGIDILKQDLRKLIELGLPHISVYGLTIEEGTVFGNWTKKGKLKINSEDFEADQLEWIMDELSSAGYIQYEISNFCKAGHESRHNQSYWEDIPYLGLGPSAHSFDGEKRWKNINNNARYIKAIHSDAPLREYEVLDSSDKVNDYILTSIRTHKGCDINHLKAKWSFDLRKEKSDVLELLVGQGLLQLKQNKLHLTRSGKLLADMVAYRLFI